MRDSFLPTAREIVLGDVAQKGNPMPTQDIDKLEQAAREATPGPWHIEPTDGPPEWVAADDAEPGDIVCEAVCAGTPHSFERWPANARFIALANPQAILFLISQVREAEAAKVEALRERNECIDGCVELARQRSAAEAALATLKREVEEAHAAMDEADPDLPRGDQRIAERFSHYVRGLASSGSVGSLALLSGRVGGSSGAAVVPDDWRCPSCHCHSWAHVDELKHDGHFGPGPEIRCVHCKRTFDLSSEAPSPQSEAQPSAGNLPPDEPIQSGEGVGGETP